MKLKKPRKEEVRILVVDDETIVALDIKNTLEKYGYNVIGVASNSGEAIKMVKTSRPNLILMDIMIKGSKDGIETSSEINKFADIPIIFLTAYSDDDTLERAKVVEPYGYLIKPFDNRELFTTIEMSLYKHSMEVSIRESEENLSITLNSIGDAVISTDENGIVVKMNPVAEKLTGWKFDDAKGFPLEKIFHLIDATTRKSIPNPIGKVIESGNVIGLSNNTLLIAKDGTERNISDSAAPIKDAEGNIRGVVLVFSDVTESYNSRKKLKESEEKFRQLISTMEQGLAVHEVIYDKKGKVVDYRFLEINDSYTKLTGLKREIVIGKTVREVLPGIEDYWIEKFGQVVITGNPVEFENYAKELGKYYHTVAYRNRPNQFAVIVTDITERKRAEERIHLMAELLDLIPASIVVNDKEGNIHFVNKTTLEMHGYTEEEFIKLNLKDIDTPESAELIEERMNIIKEKGELSFEVSHRRKDGSSFPLLVNTKITKWNNQDVLLSVSNDITEKKLQEEILRQKTEELDNYFTNAIDLFCIADTDGHFIRLNKQWENVLGYPLNELEGKKFLDFVHPEDLDATLEAISVLKGQEKLIGFTNRYRAKDGSYKFIEWRAYPAGERIYAAARDITDRKLAEDALRKSEEMFRSYVENAPDAIMVVDDKGNYVMANKAACQMTGYSIDELLKMHIMDVTYPGDFEKGNTHFKNVVEKGEATDEVRYVTKNGEVRYWSVKAVKLNDTRFLGFQTDITEKELSEIALKESEERYSLVVGASEEGIWDWDVLTNHVFFSPQWKKQIGYEDHEIENDFSEWVEHLHEDDKERCLNAVQEYITNPTEHFIIEFRFRHKNGSYRWIHNKAASILNEEGKVVRMFGAHSDITEKKLAEESIKLSEKKFNRAFHASPVAMSIQDYQDIFRDVNDAFLNLTGYTREEVIGHTGKELRLWANSEQRKYVNELFKKHEAVRNFEFEFRRKDGSCGFGILSAELISIDGKDAALTAVLDITDRQNALEALKKSEFYLNKSQQVAKIGSYLYDITKDFWIGSKTLDEIFGIDENYNKNTEGWLSIIHPEFKQIMADYLLKDVIEGKNRFDKEYKIIRVRDGKEIWVHGIGELEFDKDGNPIFMVGTIQDISERKNAEAALKESEEKFRTLFDTMPNGYYRSTHDGYFVDANPAFIKMLGYENLEELKKLHIPTDLYVKTIEREEILNRNPEFVSNVETYRLKRKDGSVIWVEDNARYIKDENGNVIYNEGICKDITDRKKAEDALRESEQLFNTLAQVSPVGIFRTRPDGYTTYVNPKWVRLSGISADKAMGNGWLDAVHPDDREKIKGGWDLAIKENDVSVAEYRFLRPNGNIIWVMGQAIPEFDAFNNIVGYVGTITDITERKLAEEALRESEERFRAITEQTSSLISVTDDNGIITYSSPAAKTIFNCDPNEMIGRPFLDFLDESSVAIALQAFQKAVGGIQNTKNIELKMKRMDGSIFYGELNGSKFEWGGKTGSLVVIQDITERKNSEVALQKSEERLRILAEKTGTIVYDRNLNTNIVHREGAIEEVLGYTKEEYNSFTVEQFNQLVHPEDLHTFITTEEKYLLLGGNMTQYYRLKHKKGHYVYIEDNSVVLIDNETKARRLLGSMKDITQRKLAEIALIESEERLRILAEKTGTIVYDRDLIKHTDHREGAIEEVLGYTREELNSFNKDQLENMIDEKDME